MTDKLVLDKIFKKSFYHNKFMAKPIEKFIKQKIYESLKNTIQKTQKGEYRKRSYSLNILAKIVPIKAVIHGEDTKKFCRFL